MAMTFCPADLFQKCDRSSDFHQGSKVAANPFAQLAMSTTQAHKSTRFENIALVTVRVGEEDAHKSKLCRDIAHRLFGRNLEISRTFASW